jgi:NitT/TauT family transport system substrate-binding protein
MRSLGIFAATAALLVSAPAIAEDVKVGIGISGWTGFAPLTLANQAGIFKKNGLDVTIKKIPQKDRHLAIASGDVQCAATTVETWISWNANGVATKQIFQLDKSYGADGMATRNDVASIKDLKGKTIAASAPGTAPYFTLAWMLKKNGLSVKDVTVVNLEPAAAAQAFVAGQNDAAMTYEPYLSTVRAAPDKGKIIATTLDYPILRDHGRRCEAVRRTVRQLGEISALAGQSREPEILRGGVPGFHQRSCRPAARDRHHKIDPEDRGPL